MISKILGLLLTILICLALASFGLGESEPTPTPDPEQKSINLDNFSWLVGHWRGSAFGGTCEEIWTPPSGGSMVGMFKLVVAEKVEFYELFTISNGSGEAALRLKHFNPDMTSWEDKNQVIIFPYLGSSEDEINFDGLTYRKKAADSLLILVDLKDSDGNISAVRIECGRVK